MTLHLIDNEALFCSVIISCAMSQGCLFSTGFCFVTFSAFLLRGSIFTSLSGLFLLDQYSVQSLSCLEFFLNVIVG